MVETGKYSVLYMDQKVLNNRYPLSAGAWASQSEFELVHFYLDNWTHFVNLPNLSGSESVIWEMRSSIRLSRECCEESVKQRTGTPRQMSGLRAHQHRDLADLVLSERTGPFSPPTHWSQQLHSTCKIQISVLTRHTRSCIILSLLTSAVS